MNGQRQIHSKLIGVALAVILGASGGAVVAGVVLPQPRQSERGAQAWSERLSGQAETYRQARIASAYSLRLLALHQQQVNRAWTDRLNAQAAAIGLREVDDRAAQAWTDRLDGLAEAYAN